jgi:hypothetical protein
MFWRKLRRGLVKVLLVCEMSKMVNIVRRSEEDKDFFLENTRREDRSVLWKSCHELAVPWRNVCVGGTLTIGEECEGTVGLLRLRRRHGWASRSRKLLEV